MTKFRVFWGIFVVFLVISVGVVAAKSDGGSRVLPQHYKLDYPKQDLWSHFPITRQRIFKELGLSDDQSREISTLRYKYKEDVRVLRNQHRESVMNVLTPSQKDTLNRRLEELKRFRSQHERPVRPNRLLFHHDGQCNDFPDRSLLERSNRTNIEPTTWSQIKILFQ